MPKTRRTSDATLVRRSQQGDRRAFSALLSRYDWRLRGLAHALLLDRADMDAALATGYLRAWRDVVRVSSKDDVTAWLYRVTYNACIDQLRRAESEAGERKAPAQPRSGIAAGLAELPAAERVAVVLVDREGFSPASAARILGLPQSVLATTLDSARERLIPHLPPSSPEPAPGATAAGATDDVVDDEGDSPAPGRQAGSTGEVPVPGTQAGRPATPPAVGDVAGDAAAAAPATPAASGNGSRPEGAAAPASRPDTAPAAVDDDGGDAPTAGSVDPAMTGGNGTEPGLGTNGIGVAGPDDEAAGAPASTDTPDEGGATGPASPGTPGSDYSAAGSVQPSGVGGNATVTASPDTPDNGDATDTSASTGTPDNGGGTDTSASTDTSARTDTPDNGDGTDTSANTGTPDNGGGTGDRPDSVGSTRTAGNGDGTLGSPAAPANGDHGPGAAPGTTVTSGNGGRPVGSDSEAGGSADAADPAGSTADRNRGRGRRARRRAQHAAGQRRPEGPGAPGDGTP